LFTGIFTVAPPPELTASDRQSVVCLWSALRCAVTSGLRRLDAEQRDYAPRGYRYGHDVSIRRSNNVYETIVVGFHKSVTGRDAVEHASALAGICKAQLHLVTSFDPDSRGEAAREDAERQLSSHQLGAGGSVKTHVLGGEIADVIVTVAGNVGADLIIVGNKDLHESKRTADSVAGAVSASAPCAVLIVPTT
jgi:nucleotide-binding universal stress UspA family protein